MFEEMLSELSALPKHGIVLLHPCCHNPTGADLSHEQWRQVIAVLASNQLIPFLDMAYQGFGKSLDEDAYAVRAMADAGLRSEEQTSELQSLMRHSYAVFCLNKNQNQ